MDVPYNFFLFVEEGNHQLLFFIKKWMYLTIFFCFSKKVKSKDTTFPSMNIIMGTQKKCIYEEHIMSSIIY